MRLIAWIKSLFSREIKPSPDARVFDMRNQNSWGDSVQWFDIPTGRVYGHMESRPTEGDILLSRMRSGRVGKFVFVEVSWEYNPPDMFFGTVKQIGYLEEPELTVTTELY